MPASDSHNPPDARVREDPRIDWGPGEWFDETQRLEAENERLREALKLIAAAVNSWQGAVALKALEAGER